MWKQLRLFCQTPKNNIQLLQTGYYYSKNPLQSLPSLKFSTFQPSFDFYDSKVLVSLKMHLVESISGFLPTKRILENPLTVSISIEGVFQFHLTSFHLCVCMFLF